MPGNCFEVAAKIVAFDRPSDHAELAEAGAITLCHGLVKGQPAGYAQPIVHPHGWVEFELEGMTYCFEASNGNRVVLPRTLHYAVGEIRGEDVVRYDRMSARRMLVAHEHYGPWASPLVDCPVPPAPPRLA